MQLTQILFLYSAMHPDVGYRQGMHELLAPLYFAVDYDSTVDEEDSPGDVHADLKECCARNWVSADAWILFDAVMQGAGRWYEWQEPKSATASTSSVPAPLANHVNLSASLSGPSGSSAIALKPYVAPIVEACNRVQSTFLKSVDPELWRRMQGAGIEPQIYGM